MHFESSLGGRSGRRITLCGAFIFVLSSCSSSPKQVDQQPDSTVGSKAAAVVDKSQRLPPPASGRLCRGPRLATSAPIVRCVNARGADTALCETYGKTGVGAIRAVMQGPHKRTIVVASEDDEPRKSRAHMAASPLSIWIFDGDQKRKLYSYSKPQKAIMAAVKVKGRLTSTPVYVAGIDSMAMNARLLLYSTWTIPIAQGASSGPKITWVLEMDDDKGPVEAARGLNVARLLEDNSAIFMTDEEVSRVDLSTLEPVWAIEPHARHLHESTGGRWLVERKGSEATVTCVEDGSQHMVLLRKGQSPQSISEDETLVLSSKLPPNQTRFFSAPLASSAAPKPLATVDSRALARIEPQKNEILAVEGMRFAWDFVLEQSPRQNIARGMKRRAHANSVSGFGGIFRGALVRRDLKGTLIERLDCAQTSPVVGAPRVEQFNEPCDDEDEIQRAIAAISLEEPERCSEPNLAANYCLRALQKGVPEARERCFAVSRRLNEVQAQSVLESEYLMARIRLLSALGTVPPQVGEIERSEDGTSATLEIINAPSLRPRLRREGECEWQLHGF